MTTFARVRLADGSVSFARVEGDSFVLLSDAPWSGGKDGRTIAKHEATLTAPVTPSKIICVGRNYRAHAKEMGSDVPKEPLLFLKPPSAVIGPDDAIVMPPESERVDHEGELGIVIGRGGRRIARADALSHVFGATAVNDVTARDLQKKDGQWSRAKGFDTFCPVGPVIVTGLDLTALSVACRVRGETRQSGNTRDMIFPVDELVAYISAAFTLLPGDLIVTGTPEGVGPLAAGDVVEVEVEGVGVLSSRVVAT
jgi:2-keto-4-pentenoate hydratase/2-oxohepta-3-ene-1,7-dioic acid hydratase in catechol pathway